MANTKKIIFNKKFHKYYINNKPLKWSVTQYINDRLFPKFNPYKVLTKLVDDENSQYYQCNIEQVRKKWVDKGQEASKKGIKFHKKIEKYYEEEQLLQQLQQDEQKVEQAEQAEQQIEQAEQKVEQDEQQDEKIEQAEQKVEQVEQKVEQAEQKVEQAEQKVEQVEQAEQKVEQAEQKVEQVEQDNKNKEIVSKEYQYFLNFINKHNYLKPFKSEFIIYDEKLNMGGCVDMIYINSKDNSYVLCDWKRSECIKTTNPYENGINEMKDYPNTNYWKYVVQLNLYSKILKKNYNIQIKKMYIIVLHPNNDNYLKYKIPYLKEIEKIYKNIKNEIELFKY